MVIMTSFSDKKAGVIHARFAPWYRATFNDPFVCALIWSSQLDITERRHTSRVVLGPD